MRQTFEELIENFETNPNYKLDLLSNNCYYDTLNLLKQVREATIQECINLQKSGYLKNVNGYSFRKEFKDLDKDSIEI